MGDDDRKNPVKTLGEKLDELWQGVLGALEALVTPEPVLIPVPVRSRPTRQRSRRG